MEFNEESRDEIITKSIRVENLVVEGLATTGTVTQPARGGCTMCPWFRLVKSSIKHEGTRGI
jgi:hypothetical protein